MDSNTNSDKKRELESEGAGDPYAPEPERVTTGELLVWRPSRRMTNHIPAVTIGAFRSGVPCINFRQYKLKERGVLEATADGIAVSFSEFDVIFERLRLIAEGTPDAAA